MGGKIGQPETDQKSSPQQQPARCHAKPSWRLSWILCALTQSYGFAWPMPTSRLASGHSNRQVLGPGDVIHERWPSRSQRGIRIAKWVLFTCRLGVLAKRGFTQTQRPTHRENWARPVNAVGNVPWASGPAKGGKPIGGTANSSAPLSGGVRFRDDSTSPCFAS